jgi:hypothetical protein
MASPILARADALMNRRRQSTGDSEEVPLLTDAIGADDDIPVLLDVETPAPVTKALPEVEPITEPVVTGLVFEGEMLDIVAHELARRVHERLAAELPGIIETTIRDFLAEPDILALIQPRD